MDNIHKYYYLIVFTAYMREMAEGARTTMTDEQKAALTLPGGKTAIPGNQLKLPRTFAAFMEEHSDLRGLIDSDEDPPRPREGRGGEPYREEDHHTGPLRNPWQVHLEACLSLHSLWKSHPKMLLKLKVLIVLPS